MAKPGEFSERAFLNGKIDLPQAEAIADLINASSVQAANNAVHSLQGEFSKYIHSLNEQIIKLRTYVEAEIDFSEEEIDFLAMGQVREQLHNIVDLLDKTLESAKQGVLLREGATIVIAGQPNVGKSSLLNKLSGEETAIVTEIPGTTRDVLHAHINLDGIPLHILDTAGLRESSDKVEQEGIKRAKTAITKADHVLLMLDASSKNVQNPHELYHEIFKQFADDPNKIIIIHNKIDLTEEDPKITCRNNFMSIYLSAKSGAGLDLLKQHIKNILGFNNNIEGKFSARRRHLDALSRAKKFLLNAQNLLQKTVFELVAEELRLAQKTLGEITGEFSTEDLLERIFREFCVGK